MQPKGAPQPIRPHVTPHKKSRLTTANEYYVTVRPGVPCGGELPTWEAFVEALSGRGSGRSETPQRGAAVQPRSWDYLPEPNGRFARVAAKPEDYHRRALRASELDRIFRVERERTQSAKTRWCVVRYENRFFQLERRHYAPAESKVTVCEGRHGHITIEYRRWALPCREIAAPARPKESGVKPAGRSPRTAIGDHHLQILPVFGHRLLGILLPALPSTAATSVPGNRPKSSPADSAQTLQTAV